MVLLMCTQRLSSLTVFRVCTDPEYRQFNGLIDVYTKTLKSDGIQGLYRGFVISAV